jgi:iron(III) transport system substrate-binding protein
MAWRISILVAFVILLVMPLVLRPSREAPPADAKRLIIITPHNEQIRTEFACAFDAWHVKNFGERVEVLWNVPGGTSEIRKMLQAQFKSAIEAGREPGGDADLVFGGGSYEHNIQLKGGVQIDLRQLHRDELALIEKQHADPQQRLDAMQAFLVDRYGERLESNFTITEPIITPVDFDDRWLREVYGENDIGGVRLYDPDLHWFGTALSGFGIMFNRDCLALLEIEAPTYWSDLCHPKLQGWIAGVNPGQSGSVTTAFQAILDRRGWARGWQILRRSAANARYFSGSSLKPPTDVSNGDAAMGICIDFYGRYQSHAIALAGDPDRLGYVDPPGVSTIDPDPISMLRNAPHPKLAKRFIEFCISPEGQSLWQFRTDDTTDDLGPEQFELRRLPIIRSMYDRYADRMIDDVNPYVLAAEVENPNSNRRSFIALIYAAAAMDTHEDLRAAWEAITSHPAYPETASIVSSDEVSDSTLREMLRLFDAMPDVPGPDDSMYSMQTDEHLGTIKAGWLRGGWKDAGLWPAAANPRDVLRRQWTRFFRSNYCRIVQLAHASPPHVAQSE